MSYSGYAVTRRVPTFIETLMLRQQTNEERGLHQQREHNRHEAVSFLFSFAAGRSFCCYSQDCDEEFFSDVIILVLSPPGIIVPLSAGKRGTIIQGGGWYKTAHPFVSIYHLLLHPSRSRFRAFCAWPIFYK